MVCRFNPFYVGAKPPTCCTSDTIKTCDCPLCPPDTGYQEPRCQCSLCCLGYTEPENGTQPVAKTGPATAKGFSKCTATTKTVMCNPSCKETDKKCTT